MIEARRTMGFLGFSRYALVVTPPHAAVPWRTERPVGLFRLRRELLRLGNHPTDVEDAIQAADTTWRQSGASTAGSFPRTDRFDGLVGVIRAWHEAERPPAELRGTSLRLGQSPSADPSQAAWIDIERNGRFGRLILWSAGMAVVESGGKDWLGRLEHLECVTPAELREQLDRLLLLVEVVR